MKSDSILGTAEHRLVDKIKDWTGSRFIGDDCAILPGGLIVSIDSLAENTHFSLETTSLADLGWKTAAVNLSDIAAMAGRPRHMLVSLSLTPSLQESQIAEFYSGLNDCAQKYRVKIAGGDLIKSKSLMISITVIGDTHEHGVLKRDGAQPGDVVIVSGDFGASAAGLHLLLQATGEQPLPASIAADFRHFSTSYCINRHRRPIPRLCESWALNRAATGRGALMDASDGLADALAQIAMASGVGMKIDLEKVPVHHETIATAKKDGFDHLDWVLYGGEDYELVACISEESWKKLCDSNGEHNPFTKIGIVEKLGDDNRAKDPYVTLLHEGKPAPPLDLNKCFQHVCPTQ